MPIDQMDKVFQQVAAARRVGGMAQRHGLVHEVKEGGGERKVRLVLGFHNGKPWLSPWMNTEEHRGGTSSQQQVEKGQPMVMTCHNGDYRNVTCTPSSESKANPQPPHAPQFQGDTTSNGSKVRTATNKPGQSSGGGTSLLGTAEVLTPDGFKNIQQLKLGDKVISCATDVADSKPVVDTIIGLHAALTKKPVFILSYNGGSLRCTGDHTIWIETRNQYVASASLGFLDKLRGYEELIDIVSLVPHPVAEHEVYDLTVETNGNFFARDGGDGVPILVHNAGGGGGQRYPLHLDRQQQGRARAAFAADQPILVGRRRRPAERPRPAEGRQEARPAGDHPPQRRRQLDRAAWQ